MHILRKIVVALLVVVLVLAVCSVVLGFRDQREKYPQSDLSQVRPEYEAFSTDFRQKFRPYHAISFACGAVIDIDNDGRDEIFLGGGSRQADALFRYKEQKDGEGELVDISAETGLVKLGGGVTTGVAVLDVDDNGFSDLIVSHENGIFLYLNDGKTLHATRLDIDLDPEELPLGAAVTDLNGDGHFDFFLPVVKKIHFLASSAVPDGGKIASHLFLNKGDNSFQDVTFAAGVAEAGTALQALFADLDRDGNDDLIVLQDDGHLKVWKNLGNMILAPVKDVMPGKQGVFLGMAAGDYNNDGLLDIFLTNSGTTIPSLILKKLGGSSEEYSAWTLLQNNGDFRFEDKGKDTGIAGYEMGRGALMSDCNGDGLQDLFVAQNHPWCPLYWVPQLRLSGKVLLQNGEGVFSSLVPNTSVTDILANREFGLTPLEADVNGDAIPDLVYVNVGGIDRVLVNKTKGLKYLKIVLPDTAASLGAQVRIQTQSGKTIERPFLVGKALCSDSGHPVYAGFDADTVLAVTVIYRDGRHDHHYGKPATPTLVFEPQE